ncbi:hypothetical protein BDP27DRAFT_1429110 [Rhodocollybia butyracea]|uniref:Uncharacterized protein n=1 Tax=Rhodocollybia butyracea TaxID=206335 RepID=A0A9P5PAE2_9AGAR|nr:hypothetical protein BDP27DRAFT_1429110 [Rhodocollybia butyracea]
MSSDLTASICETYHPQFNSPEADITLSSLEGTLYRIPSFVLKSTSGFFESCFLYRLLRLPSRLPNCPPNLHLPPQSPPPKMTPSSSHALPHERPPHPRLVQDPSDDPDPEADDKRYTELETLLTLAESWEAPGPSPSSASALPRPCSSTSLSGSTPSPRTLTGSPKRSSLPNTPSRSTSSMKNTKMPSGASPRNTSSPSSVYTAAAETHS